MADIIVLTAIAIAVALAIRSIARNKKSGKSSCGGDCDNCKKNI